ncbi:MAG: glycine cleavage system aminomethyltransferase GcvT [Chloroflexota bacterium]
MSDDLSRTSLFTWHADNGGRMVPFSGWEMPVQYPTGPLEEHHITRRSAGLFDIDHMGQIEVSGPDAEAYLNRVVTWDISTMSDYDAHYALLCREDGGVLDDLFIYKLPQRWLVVVNAGNRQKDFAWMVGQIDTFQVNVEDISDETYMLALQGPKAINLLNQLTDVDLNVVPRFTAIEAQVNDTATLIGRTGYTGEDGVELFFPAQSALTLWEAILSAGPANEIEVAPIGLAARDSLRFEPSFPLYGHEITEEITPLEANLRWACSWNKEFIGRASLLAQKEAGIPRKIVGLTMTEKGVPREGYPVLDGDGQEVGVVVSGMYAPTVDQYCAHALVQRSSAKVGTGLQVQIRKNTRAAVVTKRPFYKPAYR